MSSDAKVYYSINSIDQDLISRWRVLAHDAISANAYLTPEFVIPADKLLTTDSDLVIIIVEEQILNETKLIALGVFQVIQPTLKLPFTYLTTYRSTHSFLGGILAHKKFPFAIKDMLKYIKSLNKWAGVQFSEFQKTNEINQCNLSLKNDNIFWFKFNQYQRVILYPSKSGLSYLENNLNKKYLKNLRRKKRNLEKIGEFSWRIVFADELNDQTIKNFLELEHSGWKGKMGTSLLSDSNSCLFFEQLVNGFKENNNVFFTEIRLNDITIASTCNFVSGNVGFAFKLAWNEEYAKYSIGNLNEIELIKNAPNLLNFLSYVDGSNMPGSFLEKLWVNNVTLVTGIYSLNFVFYIFLKISCKIKSIKNIVFSLKTQ